MRIAVRSLFLLGENVEVVTRIICELVRVADIEGFRRSKNSRQRLRVCFKEDLIADVLHHAFRTVHREDVSRLDNLIAAYERFSVFTMIAVHRERETFKKSAIHARRVTEVYRRPENKNIRLTRAFQNGTQVVANGANAVGLRVLEFAGKAALTTRKREFVQVHDLRFRTRLARALSSAFERLGSIPSLTWASVKKHCKYFSIFHNCFLVTLFAGIRYESSGIYPKLTPQTLFK